MLSVAGVVTATTGSICATHTTSTSPSRGWDNRLKDRHPKGGRNQYPNCQKKTYNNKNKSHQHHSCYKQSFVKTTYKDLGEFVGQKFRDSWAQFHQGITQQKLKVYTDTNKHCYTSHNRPSHQANREKSLRSLRGQCQWWCRELCTTSQMI